MDAFGRGSVGPGHDANRPTRIAARVVRPLARRLGVSPRVLPALRPSPVAEYDDLLRLEEPIRAWAGVLGLVERRRFRSERADRASRVVGRRRLRRDRRAGRLS